MPVPDANFVAITMRVAALEKANVNNVGRADFSGLH
jgi:hypothetical protein